MRNGGKFWSERLNMENDAYWKFEDLKKHGKTMKVGAGTLGTSTLGSCGLSCHNSAAEREPAGQDLLKTFSLPMLATVNPCGQRIGGLLPIEKAEEKQPSRMGGGMEDRLVNLELTFNDTRAANIANALGRPRSTIRSSLGSRAGSTRSVPPTASTIRSLARGESRGLRSSTSSMREGLRTPTSVLDGRFQCSTVGIESPRSVLSRQRLLSSGSNF
mmetsp:Transcript_33282/g.52981  ORF Transcript_33282/g.52981 Transcript_33282/m.52981 type:complete len:216 (+) Transcript_33282:77-724(+)